MSDQPNDVNPDALAAVASAPAEFKLSGRDALAIKDAVINSSRGLGQSQVEFAQALIEAMKVIDAATAVPAAEGQVQS